MTTRDPLDGKLVTLIGGSGFIDCGGGAFPEQPEGRSPEMDAVAAFVLSLRPRPNPHLAKGRPRGEIRESAVRGKALFLTARESVAAAAIRGRT